MRQMGIIYVEVRVLILSISTDGDLYVNSLRPALFMCGRWASCLDWNQTFEFILLSRLIDRASRALVGPIGTSSLFLRSFVKQKESTEVTEIKRIRIVSPRSTFGELLSSYTAHILSCFFLRQKAHEKYRERRNQSLWLRAVCTSPCVLYKPAMIPCSPDGSKESQTAKPDEEISLELDDCDPLILQRVHKNVVMTYFVIIIIVRIVVVIIFVSRSSPIANEAFVNVRISRNVSLSSLHNVPSLIRVPVVGLKLSNRDIQSLLGMFNSNQASGRLRKAPAHNRRAAVIRPDGPTVDERSWYAGTLWRWSSCPWRRDLCSSRWRTCSPWTREEKHRSW